MPEKTLDAVADHSEITGDTITGTYDESNAHLDRLAELGIDYDEVVNLLEKEGVEKFEASWAELLETVQSALDSSR